MGAEVQEEATGVANRLSFNNNWRFRRFGSMPDGSISDEPVEIESPDFCDADWRVLDLPHDWGIEGPFRPELDGATGKLPWVGIGWYRKRFRLSDCEEENSVFVRFDGAMSQAEVWLNGIRVGEWKYGYTSFRVDLTSAINFEGENLLAVRLDNPPASSRWYPGGGLYRNVWLERTGKRRFTDHGVFIYAKSVSENQATACLEIELENAADVASEALVDWEIQEFREENSGEQSPSICGEPMRLEVSANSTIKTSFEIVLDSARRWGLVSRNRYRAQIQISSNGRIEDAYEVRFGLREIAFDTKHGFLLNGVRLHHDLGPLGTAINNRAMERQLEILKEMGCNAIRAAHNPPAAEFLELCDRMGFLVIVEAFDCWAETKVENDYVQHFDEWHERDLSSMVLRDRNHPSVILWSTGNEILEQKTKQGHEISRRLTSIVRNLDPTRLVTAGCNFEESGFNGFARTHDVFGYNYKPHLYREFLDENPGMPLLGSETASTVSSRGEYVFPVEEEGPRKGMKDGQVSSFDIYYPQWASTPDREFEAQDRNSEVLGEFVWTGFDYLGEPTPYNPDLTNLLNAQTEEERERIKRELIEWRKNCLSRSSYFGIIDLCGFPKDRFYLYQSRWRSDLPMAHLLPHWTWPGREGQTTPVMVYTTGEEAELFLNGHSLGRKRRGDFVYRIRWDDVSYEPGELKVVAYRDREKWVEASVYTAGEAVGLSIEVDRALLDKGGQDLCFATIRVVDANGFMVPTAQHQLDFEIDGAATLEAVCNGDATSHESFQGSSMQAYNGMCLAILRTKRTQTGRAALTVHSDGLAGTSADVSVI